jgi:protein-disulfide isomerase
MSEKILIPLSILVSSLLIAFAVYVTIGSDPIIIETSSNKEDKATAKVVDIKTDHILGKKDADIFVIEYFDLECLHCKKYYTDIVKTLRKQFSDNDRVSFVFRHFPLTSEHKSSFEEAVATECAAELGGEEKFFSFKSKIFDETASDGNFSSTKIKAIAAKIGLEKEAFGKCLGNQSIQQKVTDSYEEALRMGLDSTPSVFLQVKNGETYSIPAELVVIKNLLDAYFLENK